MKYDPLFVKLHGIERKQVGAYVGLGAVWGRHAGKGNDKTFQDSRTPHPAWKWQRLNACIRSSKFTKQYTSNGWVLLYVQ